jgi:hypothetical protein
VLRLLLLLLLLLLLAVHMTAILCRLAWPLDGRY